jgi:hypothetical protein
MSEASDYLERIFGVIETAQKDAVIDGQLCQTAKNHVDAAFLEIDAAVVAQEKHERAGE